MRIVVALGGNALLKRGEPMTHDVQRANIRVAAQALAPVAGEHELVLAHGDAAVETGSASIVVVLDGGFVVCGQSTSKMTKAEMCELQELIEAFGAEKGVRFTAPEGWQ